MNYHFDWDVTKAIANITKHKVSFEQGATVFSDPRSLSLYDTDHSEEEDRWITLGISSSGIMLVVVHTWALVDEETCYIRIISCRRATIREQQDYKE